MVPPLEEILTPGYFLRERGVLKASEWPYRREGAGKMVRKLEEWDSRTTPVADRIWNVCVELSSIGVAVGGLAHAVMRSDSLLQYLGGVAVSAAAYAGIRVADAFLTHYNRRSIWQSISSLRKTRLPEAKEHNHIENNYYFDFQTVGGGRYVMSYDEACERCTALVINDPEPPLYLPVPAPTIAFPYRWRMTLAAADPAQDHGFDDSA